MPTPLMPPPMIRRSWRPSFGISAPISPSGVAPGEAIRQTDDAAEAWRGEVTGRNQGIAIGIALDEGAPGLA
tara:strand:- start:576 stop:791 length:216 start_codon:yes stop_codon:yes gene_type:complete